MFAHRSKLQRMVEMVKEPTNVEIENPVVAPTSLARLANRFTTPALYRRSLRWFEAYPCRPTPKDLPSSIAQHGCSITFINYINTPSRLLGTPSSR